MAKTKSTTSKTTSSKTKTKSSGPATNARGAKTDASEAVKARKRAPTVASEDTTEASGVADEAIEVPDASPKLKAVALVAPARRGRMLLNRAEALQNCEVRLKLAWLHRNELDPVLPQKPSFHAHAWTALKLLQASASAEQEDTEKAQTALEALLAELVKIRKIVAATTARDDEVRGKVGFGKTLRATRALIEDGEAILRGAEQIQATFPALTSALLSRGKAALDRARTAVARSKSREVESSVHRANQADEQQLALDVLLSCIDHLRAAALSALSDTRPKLAELLAAPLEARSRGDDEDTNEEAPTPAPDAEK